MEDDKVLYKDLSYQIVGAAMKVHTELGPGFLEKVYENALMIKFEESGIAAKAQVPVQVQFHDHLVGEYFADILVNDQIILELKAQDRIADIHRAQALNYLRATGFRLAILINFGRDRLEHHRIVL